MAIQSPHRPRFEVPPSSASSTAPPRFGGDNSSAPQSGPAHDEVTLSAHAKRQPDPQTRPDAVDNLFHAPSSALDDLLVSLLEDIGPLPEQYASPDQAIQAFQAVPAAGGQTLAEKFPGLYQNLRAYQAKFPSLRGQTPAEDFAQNLETLKSQKAGAAAKAQQAARTETDRQIREIAIRFPGPDEKAASVLKNIFAFDEEAVQEVMASRAVKNKAANAFSQAASS